MPFRCRSASLKPSCSQTAHDGILDCVLTRVPGKTWLTHCEMQSCGLPKDREWNSLIDVNIEFTNQNIAAASHAIGAACYERAC